VVTVSWPFTAEDSGRGWEGKSSVRGVEEGIIPNHKAAGSPQPH